MRRTENTTITRIASAMSAMDNSEGQAQAGALKGTRVAALSQRPSASRTEIVRLSGRRYRRFSQ